MFPNFWNHTGFRLGNGDRDRYQKLTNNDDVQDLEKPGAITPQRTRIDKRARIFAILTLMNLGIFAASCWVLLCHRTSTAGDGRQLYSPLDHAVAYHNIRFNQGLFGERTRYMGSPTNETENAWRELSEHGMIKMDSEQAAELQDPTVYDEGEGYWIGGVEMWHQLHCLNMLRRHIWAETPEVLRGKKNRGTQHMDHCIDYLRQVIICHGDVGIVPFRRTDGINQDVFVARFDAVRSCRKYEPLLAWVDKNQAGNNTPDGPLELS